MLCGRHVGVRARKRRFDPDKLQFSVKGVNFGAVTSDPVWSGQRRAGAFVGDAAPAVGCQWQCFLRTPSRWRKLSSTPVSYLSIRRVGSGLRWLNHVASHRSY